MSKINYKIIAEQYEKLNIEQREHIREILPYYQSFINLTVHGNIDHSLVNHEKPHPTTATVKKLQDYLDWRHPTIKELEVVQGHFSKSYFSQLITKDYVIGMAIGIAIGIFATMLFGS